MVGRIFVDTSVVLSPNFRFSDFEQVVISIISIEELDNLKTSDTKGYFARQAIRKIIEADNVEIKLDYKVTKSIHRFLDYKNDNYILSFFNDEWVKDEDIILLTDDFGMLVKAQALGFPCRLFEFDKNSNNNIYSGYRRLILDQQELQSLSENPSIYNFYPNEYIIVNNKTSSEEKLFTWNDRYIEEVKVKPISNKYINKINPLDIYQKAFFHMLQNDEVKIKITDSIYGVGKSFLMIHWSLQMLEKEKFNKLYFVKSDSPPKGRREFPAIPGDVVDKFEPLLGVLCDVTSEDNVTDILLRNNKLEIVPIQFIKGRSLRKAILYINECQDFTPSEMERLLSRIGEDTVVLLDGSTAQIDNKYCLNRNGLTTTSNNFKDKLNSAQVNMIEDYRSEISKMVSQMDWSD